MKERGILFSGPMVRALLDGTKTQTRRALKPQPWASRPIEAGHDGEAPVVDAALHGARPGAEVEATRTPCHSPYGQPGDRLWVRETFFAYGRWETRHNQKKQRDAWYFVDMTAACDRHHQYAADNPALPLMNGRSAIPGWHTRSALFMPRAVSRILLEVVSVRVERLQDISEADAVAEGRPRRPGAPDAPQEQGDAARDWYMHLWEQINGAGSWGANPWVWVVEFRRVGQ